jgi:hypothetical protein
MIPEILLGSVNLCGTLGNRATCQLSCLPLKRPRFKPWSRPRKSGSHGTPRWREGFELPVPRERDLNLTLCRTAGTVSSNKSEVRARSAMPIRVGLNALFHDKRLSNPSPA